MQRGKNNCSMSRGKITLSSFKQRQKPIYVSAWPSKWLVYFCYDWPLACNVIVVPLYRCIYCSRAYTMSWRTVLRRTAQREFCSSIGPSVCLSVCLSGGLCVWRMISIQNDWMIEQYFGSEVILALLNYTVSQKNIADVFSYNSRKHCRVYCSW